MLGDNPFLNAILANPADDFPRLVYADWLDERGDPRGEFIRVQIEIAKLDRELMSDEDCETPDCPGCIERRPLRARERELLAADSGEPLTKSGTFPGIALSNEGEWVRPLQDFSVRDWQWSRGFISHIACTADDWLRHADAITAATPLERVAWTDWPSTLIINTDYVQKTIRLEHDRWGQFEFTVEEIGQGDWRPVVAGRVVRQNWPAIKFTLPSMIISPSWNDTPVDIRRQIREVNRRIASPGLMSPTNPK